MQRTSEDGRRIACRTLAHRSLDSQMHQNKVTSSLEPVTHARFYGMKGKCDYTKRDRERENKRKQTISINLFSTTQKAPQTMHRSIAWIWLHRRTFQQRRSVWRTQTQGISCLNCMAHNGSVTIKHRRPKIPQVGNANLALVTDLNLHVIRCTRNTVNYGSPLRTRVGT